MWLRYSLAFMMSSISLLTLLYLGEELRIQNKHFTSPSVSLTLFLLLWLSYFLSLCFSTLSPPLIYTHYCTALANHFQFLRTLPTLGAMLTLEPNVNESKINNVLPKKSAIRISKSQLQDSLGGGSLICLGRCGRTDRADRVNGE